MLRAVVSRVPIFFRKFRGERGGKFYPTMVDRKLLDRRRQLQDAHFRSKRRRVVLEALETRNAERTIRARKPTRAEIHRELARRYIKMRGKRDEGGLRKRLDRLDETITDYLVANSPQSKGAS